MPHSIGPSKRGGTGWKRHESNETASERPRAVQTIIFAKRHRQRRRFASSTGRAKLRMGARSGGPGWRLKIVRPGCSSCVNLMRHQRAVGSWSCAS